MLKHKINFLKPQTVTQDDSLILKNKKKLLPVLTVELLLKRERKRNLNLENAKKKVSNNLVYMLYLLEH